MSAIQAEVDIDSYLAEEKPKYFHIDIEVEDHKPQKFTIDRINGEEIKPIRLDVVERKDSDDLLSVRSKVKIKKLAKQFAKGINRFDVAFYEGDERISTEIILNLQF